MVVIGQCSRCFSPSTHMIFGAYKNGRPVMEEVCPKHLPGPDDKGTIRRLDDNSRRNHPRDYRVDQWVAK